MGDQQRQGVAVYGAPGTVRSFFRNSVSWAQDPGSGLWVKVPFAVEPINADGLTLRPARVNLLARSSMVSGTTGLTPTVGSGAIALDTAQTAWMFDDSVQATQQSLKFTAGNPNVTGPKERWPDSADPDSYWHAGGVAYPVRLAIYHRDDGGEALSYSLLDAATAKYWTSGVGWSAPGAAEVWNTITLGAATGWTLYSEAVTGPAAGASSLRLRIAQPDGGTAGRINHVGHVEIQAVEATLGGCLHYSPLVVTDATAGVTRAADYLGLEKAGGVLSDPCTILATYSPEWAGTAPSAGLAQIFFQAGARHADGSLSRCALTGWASPLLGALVLQWTDDGVSDQATVTGAMPGGADYHLAFRYDSGTSDVFFNGTKCAGPALHSFFDDSWKGPLVFGAPGSVAGYLGSDFAVPCGAIKSFAIYPYAMTDAEIAAEAL